MKRNDESTRVGNNDPAVSRDPRHFVSVLPAMKNYTDTSTSGQTASSNTDQRKYATTAAASHLNAPRPTSSFTSALSEMTTEDCLSEEEEEEERTDGPVAPTLSKKLPLLTTPPHSPPSAILKTPPLAPPITSTVISAPPKEAPRATSRIISQAPQHRQQDMPLPPATSQSPLRTIHSSNRSQSPRRYDTSPFKSMRSSPRKYHQSPSAKSLQGQQPPTRSARSSSRSVFSLPALPSKIELSLGTHDSEFPLEEEDLEEENAKNRNIRTWFIFLIVGVLLLLIIVGAVMTLAIRHANENNTPATVTSPDTVPPVEQLSVAPTVAAPEPTQSLRSPPPTRAPTFSDGFRTDFPDVLTRLATFFTNDQGASIRAEGTPQNRAYRWLEQDMFFQDEPLLDARMVQRYALAVFYFSTNGDLWNRGENWLSTLDECLWQTDAVDGTSCTVTKSEISQLMFDKNSIGGSLPSELALLTNLEVFSIVNDPTGTVKLAGTIPPELGKLTLIQEFVLKNHDMSNATIPDSLFLEWPRATQVLMERCQLTGRIPTTIGLLQSATKASFRKNDLTGPIPTEVGTMLNMLQFSVDANRLTGFIPTELGLMLDATGIWLNSNQLVGPIPNEFGNLIKIKAGLRLADNELTGTIPTSLAALTDMRNFELQNNFLTGPIPEFGALVNLKSLFNIRDNDLIGSISNATCAAIVAGGAEAYADCPNEVSCACCLNCPV